MVIGVGQPEGGRRKSEGGRDLPRCGGLASSLVTRHSSTGRRLIWIVAAAAALSGCTTSPMTGRSQLLMVSEQAAVSGSAAAYSNMIGQFNKKNKIETDTPRVERVKEITNRLIAEAVRFRPDSASWQWEIEVLDDPKTVNAFCMAGGKMGIYTGFWEKLKATDDEVAAVMGHEIGHALADHTREKMSTAMMTNIGVTLLSALLSARSNDPTAFQRNQSAYGSAASMAVTLPNSREAESEADQIGIELAARAGFDPRAAVSLWKKMAEQGGSQPEFLSTHPSPENRMQKLDALVEKVDPLYQLAKDGKATAQIPMFISPSGPRYVSKDDPVEPGISRAEYAAKVAAEGQVMTFVAEEFEKFKRGDVVFQCTSECALSYTMQKGQWKRLYDKQAWRDLAVSVVKVGYLNDLTYFFLAEAAKGLGNPEAAKKYYARAIEATKADKTCAGLFNTCDGFDVPKLAEMALAEK